MIKKLLLVAVGGVMLALLSIGGAIAIGGTDLRGAFKDGRFEWDPGAHDGQLATKELVLDVSKPLAVSMPLDMQFQRSETVSMKVEGPAELIKDLVYENGELKLRKVRNSFDEGIKLTITAPVLPALDISGPANIVIEDMRQPLFKLSMAGAGNVEASGKVERLEVEASGAGNVDLTDLEAGDADIDLAGLGNADINAVGKVNVSIAGAGNVTLHRKPRELKSDIAGLGNVDHSY
jgi:hypothetical protein